MSQRSEHGGGEASINREAAEALAHEIEKADRRYRAATGIGRKAIEETDNIEEDRDKLLPPLYD